MKEEETVLFLQSNGLIYREMDCPPHLQEALEQLQAESCRNRGEGMILFVVTAGMQSRVRHADLYFGPSQKGEE